MNCTSATWRARTSCQKTRLLRLPLFWTALRHVSTDFNEKTLEKYRQQRKRNISAPEQPHNNYEMLFNYLFIYLLHIFIFIFVSLQNKCFPQPQRSLSSSSTLDFSITHAGTRAIRQGGEGVRLGHRAGPRLRTQAAGLPMRRGIQS